MLRAKSSSTITERRANATSSGPRVVRISSIEAWARAGRIPVTSMM
jgi:hypothetical protein